MNLNDIDRGIDIDFMPVVSEIWPGHFSWNGEGDIPDQERKKLEEIVERVHANEARLRFWATPENLVYGESCSIAVSI